MRLANGLFSFIIIFLLIKILYCPYPDPQNHTFLLWALLAVCHTVWFATTAQYKSTLSRLYRGLVLFAGMLIVVILVGNFWTHVAASLTGSSPLVIASNVLAICDLAYCLRSIAQSLPQSLRIAARKATVAEKSTIALSEVDSAVTERPL